MHRRHLIKGTGVFDPDDPFLSSSDPSYVDAEARPLRPVQLGLRLSFQGRFALSAFPPTLSMETPSPRDGHVEK